MSFRWPQECKTWSIIRKEYGGSFLAFISSCLDNILSPISEVEGRFGGRLHDHTLDHTRPRDSAGQLGGKMCSCAAKCAEFLHWRGKASICLQRASSHVVTFSENSTCFVCCVFCLLRVLFSLSCIDHEVVICSEYCHTVYAGLSEK